MSTQPIQNPGFCAQMYETGASGVNWLNNNSRVLAANAQDIFHRIWTAVSEFFANAGQTLGQWITVAKEAVLATKDHVINLPTNVKVVGGITMAIATLGGFFFGNACGNSNPNQNAQNQNAQNQNAQNQNAQNQNAQNQNAQNQNAQNQNAQNP